jgi:hypothetical protein
LRTTAGAAVILVASILILTGTDPAFTQRGQRVSPHESVSATIDGAEITITYGRPSMRGRAIFGALVPYGRVWCPGADEATTLDGTRALQFGALAVPSGPHTIWMLPTADTWTLVVSKEPSGFHTRYNASADLGRIELRKQSLSEPPGGIETLTFTIEKNPPAAGGVVKMMWERTEVSAPFTVVQ